MSYDLSYVLYHYHYSTLQPPYTQLLLAPHHLDSHTRNNRLGLTDILFAQHVLRSGTTSSIMIPVYAC